MKIIGTGLTGLVGSRVVELLSSVFSFENLNSRSGVDITNRETLISRIASSDATWIFHFAAKTDVDECEKEKELGKASEAWRINVGVTESIAAACRQRQKHLLYISTDFVFDGKKDMYVEEDKPSPAGWYAKTKYEGELRVKTLEKLGLIVRIAFPYRAKVEKKPDFLHRMLAVLEGGKDLTAPSDQLFVPTFIDDIAAAIAKLVDQQAFGIYHLVGSQVLSPYEAGQKIAAVFGYDSKRVQSARFVDFYQSRAPRPFYGCLSNDKIAKFGLKMSTFDEGLAAIQKQI